MPRNARPISSASNSRVQITVARMVGGDTARAVKAPIVDAKPRCASFRKDGQHCQAAAIRNVGVCVGHRRQEKAAHVDAV